MEELLALGFRSAPVTIIAGKAIVGFDARQLAEAIHPGAKMLARDPSETLPLIGRALEAVERAVRQMPDEKLDWSVPKRKRPMRELTYHIFWRAQKTMVELGADVAPTGPEAMARSYTSFQDIADYGRTIIEQYRAWVPQQNLDVLRAPPPVGSNTKSGAERLDITAGHTIQHLRQLYAVLENFGIAPESRVPDSEWPSEYVLTLLW